jgi:hypothetical protein
MTTNDARCTNEIKSGFTCKNVSEREENNLHQQIGLKIKEEPVKCCIWSIALNGAEKWTFRKLGAKYLESFEMQCWRRMEKINLTHRVRHEYVLLRVKEERNILDTIKEG